MAVDGVGEKNAAEKQNFRNQEDPHAERGGFLLLVQRLVLPKQLSGAMHSVLLQQVAVVAAPPIDRSKDRPLHRPKHMAAEGCRHCLQKLSRRRARAKAFPALSASSL